MDCHNLSIRLWASRILWRGCSNSHISSMHDASNAMRHTLEARPLPSLTKAKRPSPSPPNLVLPDVARDLIEVYQILRSPPEMAKKKTFRCLNIPLNKKKHHFTTRNIALKDLQQMAIMTSAPFLHFRIWLMHNLICCSSVPKTQNNNFLGG